MIYRSSTDAIEVAKNLAEKYGVQCRVHTFHRLEAA